VSFWKRRELKDQNSGGLLLLTTALSGALIAISFSAPPGPVALETIRRGLRGGFGPALRVQLGSIIGDVMWCALALLGLAPLAQIGWVRAALSVAGVGVLIYLGALGVRDALKKPATNTTPTPAPLARHRGPQTHEKRSASMPRWGREREGVGRGAFRSGMAISMANPMAVGYWLGVGGALVAAGVVGASAAQTASFITGFVGGTLAWAFVMAFGVRWSKQIMTPAIFRAVTFTCGAILIFFGLTLASQMLKV
jgi:chemosensory pili system protein ChpE